MLSLKKPGRPAISAGAGGSVRFSQDSRVSRRCFGDDKAGSPTMRAANALIVFSFSPGGCSKNRDFGSCHRSDQGADCNPCRGGWKGDSLRDQQQQRQGELQGEECDRRPLQNWRTDPGGIGAPCVLHRRVLHRENWTDGDFFRICSIPKNLPSRYIFERWPQRRRAPVAQLDRASVYGTEGQPLEGASLKLGKRWRQSPPTEAGAMRSTRKRNGVSARRPVLHPTPG